VADAARWWEWLETQGGASDGVVLVLAKKGTTTPTSLTYAEALEAALCFGWIDGKTQRGDDATYRQLFTPRRRASRWSLRNVGLAEELLASGRMQPPGLAEIERAKVDGRWAAAYAGPASAEVPEDLAAALSAAPRAQAMFDILTSRNRFAIVYRIADAKRPETRTRRIAEFIAMLQRGETPYPQKRGVDD